MGRKKKKVSVRKSARGKRRSSQRVEREVNRVEEVGHLEENGATGGTRTTGGEMNLNAARLPGKIC